MKKNWEEINSKISDAADISKPWDKDNQAWWDWYVGLADNDKKKDPIINAEPLPNVAIPTDETERAEKQMQSSGCDLGSCAPSWTMSIQNQLMLTTYKL